MNPSKKERLSLSIYKDILTNSRRIAAIIWQEKKGLVIAIIGILIILSAADFLISGSRGFLINELVKSVGLKTFSEGIVLPILLLAIAGFLPSIFHTLEFYFLKRFWFFLEEKFEILLIRKKSDIDVAIHEDPKHNNLFNKVREQGIWRVQNFSDRQFFIFQNFLEVIISSIILAFGGWPILLVLIAGTVPEIIVEAKYGRDIWGIYGAKGEQRRRFWDLHRHFEWLPSLREMKLFQTSARFISIIKRILQNFHAEQKNIEKKKVIIQLITLSVSQLAIVFATVWFVFKVVEGNIQIGTFTFFLASIGSLRQALSGLFSNLGRQYQDNLFIKDLFVLLDLPSAIKKPEKGVVIDPKKTPDIVFDNVTFCYPGTKKVALKNFSLVIPAGEKIAFVGANGAGKTTFVKLLCRFYDPTEGKILIGGNDLKKIDLESWYNQIGALFQDYTNYHFIVKEAIAIGQVNAKSSLEKVKLAAKASEADTFIEEWKKSYGQMLGKQFSGGVEPSIGQWQKLALARTFYRDPRILILDEPTSSIDAEAEAKIFEKLESLPKDRTVFLISHRFSTVRQASRICVLENGVIKELGTHQKLLKENKIYARLFKLQAKGYQ